MMDIHGIGDRVQVALTSFQEVRLHDETKVDILKALKKSKCDSFDTSTAPKPLRKCVDIYERVLKRKSGSPIA